VVARYGHRATPLADTTLLVTGGLHADDADLAVVADAEIYDPRETDDDPLARVAPSLLRRPGDVARDLAGAAIAECGLVGDPAGASDDMNDYFTFLP
jgi:hypothetical protein